MKCPVCNSEKFKFLTQIKTGNLYFCKKCKSNFLDRKINEEFYKEEYFTDNYEATYGKNYLEDEQNIRNYSKRRLLIIKKISEEKKIKILDIGSALGFFCDEAKTLNFMPKGVELSEYARDYTKKTFGIDVYKNIDEVNELFDCITLWFTLEHINEPEGFISKLSSLLKKDGILALSLPNGYGAFFRFNRKLYYQKRPIEHIFEPSLNAIKNLLKKKGYKIIKVEIFGLHPDRIGLPDNSFTRSIQKFLRLGDTFEIYAKKECNSYKVKS